MKRSTLLLVLASVMPSYFALFQDSGMAIGIVILSTFVGFITTCTLADEIGESLPIRQMIRLGWICHIVGVMLVYAVHQLN